MRYPHTPRHLAHKSARLCCTRILGVMHRIKAGQVFSLNCTLLNASQKKKNQTQNPGGGRAMLKLLERATLAKINAECHHLNVILKRKKGLFFFSVLFHSDLAKENFKTEQVTLSHGLWIRHKGLPCLQLECCSSESPHACPWGGALPGTISACYVILNGHEAPRLGYSHLSPANTSVLFNVQTSVLRTLLVTQFPRNPRIAHETQSISPTSKACLSFAVYRTRRETDLP